MSFNNHYIERQVVELGLAAAMPAAELQECLAREMRERVNPRIAEIFDATAGPLELLRLDRIDIDLGTITGGDWVAQFHERVALELERKLARYHPEPNHAARGSSPGAYAVNSPGEAFSRQMDTAEIATRTIASHTQSTRQLLFFLQHGRLPWWGKRPERGFCAAFAAAREEPNWDAVRSLVQRNTVARARLVEALDDALLESAVASWSGLPHTAIACAALAPIDGTCTDRLEWRHRFWLALIEWLLSGGFQEGREHELMSALNSGPNAANAAADIPPPWRDWLVTTATETGAEADSFVAMPRIDRETAAPLPVAPRDSDMRRTQRTAESEAIYLPCAGVLLLHPFLDSLFRERGLLAGRVFRDAAARMHAVHLVGALGFGIVEIPEYDLIIAKLLCGLPLEDPLTRVLLDEVDMAACDQLLAAVLEHWQGLRSNSVEWMRVQFFLRDAKLEEVDSGFRLTVERRAQDVLLASLPWGFGAIGLPWLEQKIFVRWLD